MAISDHIKRTVPFAAGLLCVALAVLIWLPLNRDAGASLVAPAPVRDAAGPNTGQILAEGAQELVNRPLFHITRRPPVVVTAPEVVPVQVTLSLTGVVNDGDLKIALMRLSNREELFRREVGERLGRWEISDITDTSVTVITADGARQIIELSRPN